MSRFKVTFHPYNKTVEVEKDTTVLSAAISAGVPINSVCGGDGVCGRCKVILKKGSVLMQATGLLSPEEKKRGVYLACLSEVQSDIEVEVPPESTADFEKLSTQELKKTFSDIEDIEPVKPAIREHLFRKMPLTVKLYLSLQPPDLNDKVSDLDRLCGQIKKVQDFPSLQPGIVNIRNLSELMRSSGWKVTVTLSRRDETTEITHIDPGDTALKNFGMCFDIGTTTLTGQLVDLNRSKILGTKTAYNKQATFGSDVITRIIYAREPDGLEKLHCAVTEEMNRMIQELISEHGVDLNDVTCVLCAGNTTMMHLLLRIDPTYIRKEPYVPTANFIPPLRATEAGIKINPRGLLYCVPGVASYVGGDVTSGVLSCGMDDESANLNVLIDIGTNGEIVLGHKDYFISCAASAGPAFEGSGVSCGMRATKGAIQKVKVSTGDFEPSYETIGKAKPRGICGSGYIDLIAEMLKAGIIDKDGKIKPLEHKRIRQSDMGREFVVVFKADADSSSDIVINEADIDNLKRAKAAIYAALSCLLKHMGLDFDAVPKIFIAGGFGTSVDINNAVNIGLLPDIKRNKIIFVGNSSLSGARAMLLSFEAMKQAEEIARKMTYLELSTEPAYMDEYIAALFFPHTDLAKFPSVKL